MATIVPDIGPESQLPSTAIKAFSIYGRVISALALRTGLQATDTTYSLYTTKIWGDPGIYMLFPLDPLPFDDSRCLSKIFIPLIEDLAAKSYATQCLKPLRHL